ncbi:MAG: DUF481 domain-containing protein [Bacteroidota bacterium]
MTRSTAVSRFGTVAMVLSLLGVLGIGSPLSAQEAPEQPLVVWSAGVEGFVTAGNRDRIVGGARGVLRLPAHGPVQVLVRPSYFLGRVNGRTADREVRADVLAYAYPDGLPGTPRLYAFGLVLYAASELRQLDRRWILGGGIGWRAVPATDAGALSLSLASVYGLARYDAAFADRTTFRLSVRAEGRVRLTDGVTVAAETFVKPAPADLGDVVWLTTASLDVALRPRLSLRLLLDDLYESVTPPEIGARDVRLTVGIRVRSDP